jgi:hypothetical protein
MEKEKYKQFIDSFFSHEFLEAYFHYHNKK